MSNAKFGVIVVLLVGLIGAVVFVATRQKPEVIQVVQERRIPDPPPRSNCPRGLCQNDPINHISTSWTNESPVFWTVTVEHHSGDTDSVRIGPGKPGQVGGILAGQRETIVESSSGERWIGVCDAKPGHDHSMKITSSGIKMLMNGIWMECGWLGRQ